MRWVVYILLWVVVVVLRQQMYFVSAGPKPF